VAEIGEWLGGSQVFGDRRHGYGCLPDGQPNTAGGHAIDSS
jgi:hypothetical protein